MQEQQSDGTSERERLLAAWQAALGHLSERFANDTIADVLVVRARRVLLLTKEHVVYCRAKNLAAGTAAYHVRWHLDMRNVNNVLSAPPHPAIRSRLRHIRRGENDALGARLHGACLCAAVALGACRLVTQRCHAGDEGQLAVIIRAYAVIKVKFAGTWRLPITKRVRTANLETFELVTSTLNDQVTAPRAWQPAEAVVQFPQDRDMRALRITAGLAAEGHEDTASQGQPRAEGRLRTV